ncbi:MAG: hypothetical protein GX259_02525, partial [Bacteroidales bacterium]|nr:hypothetical protein [Bacteroidales bacterium]
MSLINKIFPLKSFSDLSVLKTDVHSHFIPNIDDGCRTLDESIALLKKMDKIGFQNIVCTPHVQHEIYQNSKENILPAFESLKAATKRHLPNLNLHIGAEYMLDDGFSDQLKDGLISFGKKNFVLVELSFFTPHPKYLFYLQEILNKGYTPILAHPERYGYWHDNNDIFIDLQNAGVLFQINIPSLCGFYGNVIKKRAFELMKTDFTFCLGSDVHNNFYMENI